MSITVYDISYSVLCKGRGRRALISIARNHEKLLEIIGNQQTEKSLFSPLALLQYTFSFSFITFYCEVETIMAQNFETFF